MTTERNDSSLSSSNDDFKRFLDEPLSTTESENSKRHEFPTVGDKTDDLPHATGHGWLKKRKPPPLHGIPFEAEPTEVKTKLSLEKQEPAEISTSSVEIEKESYIINFPDAESGGSEGKSKSTSSKDGNSKHEKSSLEEENSSVEYSSVFEIEDEGTLKEHHQEDDKSGNLKSNGNESSHFLYEKKETENLIMDAIKKDKGLSEIGISEEENTILALNKAKDKDPSFFQMMIHSEKAEDDIIQELSTGFDKEQMPDVFQESSESSTDSLKFSVQTAQAKVSSEPFMEERSADDKILPIKVDEKKDFIDDGEAREVATAEPEPLKSTFTVSVPTRIPTPVKHIPESQQTRGKNVSFSKGVLSASEKRLEKEIDERNKEIQEQEKLIQGYQIENEKLYLELKQKKKSVYTSETKWRIETEKLRMEVGKLREQTKNLDIGQRKGINNRQDEREHQEYSIAFRKLKEETESEKKKLKHLQAKMNSFQDQTEELSNENKGLRKLKLELLEKNKLLQAELQEMENLTAKWKFEATELKQTEQELKKQISNWEIQKAEKISCVQPDRMQMQIKKLLQELGEKDSNSKSALDELRQQYHFLKQCYQKHSEDKELEEIKKMEDLESKLKILQEKLLQAEKDLALQREDMESKLQILQTKLLQAEEDLGLQKIYLASLLPTFSIRGG